MKPQPSYLLPSALAPQAALAALEGLPHRVLLESCGGSGRSVLAAEPRMVLSWSPGGGALWRPGPEGTPDEAPARTVTDPFEVLEELLARTLPHEEGVGAGFRGAWMGYLGFETGGLIERLPAPPDRGAGEPVLWLAAYDWAVVWEPGREEPRLEGAPLSGDEAGDFRARFESAASRLEAPRHGAVGGSSPRAAGHAATTTTVATTATGATGAMEGIPLDEAPGVWSTLGREGFHEGVERIRSYIRAGDLFQANLTHFLGAPFEAGGVELYGRLTRRSPAPFAAYLDTGAAEIASVSPESFLSVRGGRVETHPIKGTAPRDPDPERDQAMAQGLLASAKDRAENVMIVDLLRNDLSRVCRPGSVRVPRLAELERHPTVHHLVSTVRGELEAGVGPVELLRATLPAGSISGAPKIRALEILRELEPVRRGVYTGALGILEPGGRMELSVAIRTAVVAGGRAVYGVGGGITLDSGPEAEWRESLDKGAAFLHAVSADRGAEPRVTP